MQPLPLLGGGVKSSLLSAEKDSGESPRIISTKIVYSSPNAFFVPIAIGISKEASFFIQKFRELLPVSLEHIQSFVERLQTFPKLSGILPENTRTYPELLRSFLINTRIFPENMQSFPENVRISLENMRHSDEKACQTDRILYVNTNKSTN